MKKTVLILFTCLLNYFAIAQESELHRWSAEKANQWYDQIPYLVGANYVPASAINQLEMWQEDSFDPERIDFELNKASEIGMNTMRVFLHDLAWKQDPKGFFSRVDKYLEIADKNRIFTMFVIFDGVWNPYPKAGKQPLPLPRVHNSGWVQSPGRVILDDESKQDALKEYVQAVVGRYKDDKRVIIWDLFNEPDNANGGNFGGGSKEPDLSKELKKKRACQLLEKTFKWVREINPSQPLTAAVWGSPNWLENPDKIEKLSFEQSDVISFHAYSNAEKTLKVVKGLQKYNRPLLCTEYMARGVNSKFETHLPIFNEHRVGAYNWGLFDGKSQTIYPWNSWKKQYTKEPDPWFHDVFRKDGTPYSKKEIKAIRKYSSRPVTERKKDNSRQGVPAPLFIDPNYHGSCDPEIVWNESKQSYYIYYTSRRSKIEDNFVATPIGVISSDNLKDWKFEGYCKFDGVGGKKDASSTYWAPAIISHNDSLHMFVTWKPDTTREKGAWGGPGMIVHYKTPENNPVNGWEKVGVMHDTTMSTIDAAVYKKNELFHVWFKGRKKGQKKSELYHKVSTDLSFWEDRGFTKSDVFNKSVTGSGFEEAPYIFTWKGKDWLITDPHNGLFVYHSDDSENWHFQNTILKEGSERKLDNTMARHCSVVVKDDRAFIFYHVEPWREYEKEKKGMPIYKQALKNRQSVLQMAELELINGQLSCKRTEVFIQ